jgi:hypothetical protein
MKKLINTLIILAMLIAFSASSVFAQSSTPVDVAQELMKLEPYVTTSTVDGVQIQVLDTQRASKNGFSQETLDLAAEMVSYQNDLAKTASKSGIKDITKMAVDSNKYQKVDKFFKDQSAKLKNKKVSAQNFAVAAASSVNPCGDWNTPIPNYTPGKTWYNSSNGRSTLLNMGFHYTYFYAGQDGNNYTKWASYDSGYGHCNYPYFRWEGIVGFKNGVAGFAIQATEPNPEVLDVYPWPYWNWGTYVAWWHSTY